MLINLSNHPKEEWSATQLDIAQQEYDQIKNMSFPGIDPEWSTETIIELAQSYCQKILDLKSQLPSDAPFAVMAVGEFTFSFAIISFLQANNITCVVTTSKRNLIKEGNRKMIDFNFVSFRQFPKINQAYEK